MKKDPGETSEPVDYVVGSVSGSLFPQEASSSAGSLSALFQTKPSADTPLFIPAPKPQPKVEVREDDGAAQKGLVSKNQKKKAARMKSASDLKVEDRESSLQNADEDEQVPKTPKKKRKSAEMAGGVMEDEEDRPNKRQRTNVDRAAERVKDRKTVFIGNLPVSCTKKRLQMVFKDQGAIDSVRFRSVVREDPAMSRKVAAIQRKVHPKKQSINAYIVFKEDEGAVNALERNGMEIEKGFFIRVDRIAKHSSHDHKRSIFVGNLPFEVNELPLRQHFEDCGKVEAVRLVRDKTSGMGKGFGYVLFESIDAVQLALKLDSSKLLGRSVRVKRSVKKEKEKKNPGANRGPRGKGAGKGTGKGPHTKGTGKGPHTKGTGKGPHTKGTGKGLHKGAEKEGGDKGAGKVERGPKKGRLGQSPRNKPMGKPFQKSPGKSPKLAGSSSSGPSFTGEMADPTSKKLKKNKALKKKLKPRKRNQNIHI